MARPLLLTSLHLCIDVDRSQPQLLVLVDHAPRRLAVQPVRLNVISVTIKTTRLPIHYPQAVPATNYCTAYLRFGLELACLRFSRNIVPVCYAAYGHTSMLLLLVTGGRARCHRRDDVSRCAAAFDCSFVCSSGCCRCCLLSSSSAATAPAAASSFASAMYRTCTRAHLRKPPSFFYFWCAKRGEGKGDGWQRQRSELLCVVVLHASSVCWKTLRF